MDAVDHHRLALPFQLQNPLEAQQGIAILGLHRIDGGQQTGGLERLTDTQGETLDVAVLEVGGSSRAHLGGERLHLRLHR